ncbi:KH domain-containing protein HEN4 [Malania oleifera]|uniref:KH domain-containing protein HEN4 n=1 Tax=Malania oleifera TaxID=397392 RepID=UPI0025ADB6E7|nr:KH domain-containing protein HEN4 [Malania oleifera]
MDAQFMPTEASAATPTGAGSKRRHHSHQPVPHHLKPSAGETLFRILCPATKTGGVIGKGGAIIRQFREETGSKIRIDDAVPGCDERVILILAPDSIRKDSSSTTSTTTTATASNSSNNNGEAAPDVQESASAYTGASEDDGSPAQKALVRVFERILRVDEERSQGEGKENKEEAGIQGLVLCRLLAGSNQVGCVLGRGGKIVEKIRQASGAQVRILPKDHIPACASSGDELIQITGNFPAVKKALLSVSSCLQDNSRVDVATSAAMKSSGAALHGTGMPALVDPFPQRNYGASLQSTDYRSRVYSSTPGPENFVSNYRMAVEDEVVFRLLCQVDKVGSLIGKGGSVIRALQSETGASIKIADAAPDADERVVVISARENSEQNRSPAQDAVIRVHCRIAEVGFEPGAAVVARLLVHAQQIGCLLGKGGFIIAEMRRATGASIRIFAKEQVPKSGALNDEVVQVIGSLHSVQDALFHITSRLRETIFPGKPPFSSVNGPPYLAPFPDMPPQFRPRHDPASPGHNPSPVGHSRGADRSAVSAQPLDHHNAFTRGVDHIGLSNLEGVPYSYGTERPMHGLTFDRPSSPRSWTPRAHNVGNSGEAADVSSVLSSRNGPNGSGGLAPVSTSTTVEIVIPQALLNHVYGENSSNLSQIRQVSGAKVLVHDPKSGATEGMAVVSGTQDQTRAAQSLIQAFILCGRTS